MSAPKTTKVWKLKNAPVKEVDDRTFELSVEDLPDVLEGEAVIKTLYLSNDPAQRPTIQKDCIDERMYAPPVREGQPMAAYGIGEVVVSKSSKWRAGDLVIAGMGWKEYSIWHEDKLRPVPTVPGQPPSLALSALGGPSLTSWFALYNVTPAKPEHTVVISGAAGATGSAAVQIAKKIIGCKRVIGIAGTPDKCAWVESLGADVCLNYRAPDFAQQLVKATDGYVDVYLDHVGGSILNLMLARMKRWGKIAAVGAISAYNDWNACVYPNWMEVVANRLTITGFIVFDFIDEYPQAIAKLAAAITEGKFTVEGTETIREVQFEDVPRVWRELFSGGNTGKLLTKVMPAEREPHVSS